MLLATLRANLLGGLTTRKRLKVKCWEKEYLDWDK